MATAWVASLCGIALVAAGCSGDIGHSGPPGDGSTDAASLDASGPGGGNGHDGGFDAGAPDAGGPDAGIDPCAPIAGVAYTSSQVTPFTQDPATHGGLNLLLCGFREAAQPKVLVDYAGATDAKAPRLYSLYRDDRRPTAFAGVYQVKDITTQNTCHPTQYVSTWPVTLLGLPTAPGEVLELPRSGYDIGGGYQALVLYATERTLTLKYTRDDNIISGYTLHLTGVCAEPSLRAAYQRCHAQGRTCMPQLRGDQPLGRAIGSEVGVALRDTGSLMDPRSRKDWWP